MSELPDGWATAKISDVTASYRSIDPQQTPSRIFQYVDIGAIDNTKNIIRNPKAISGAAAPSRARRVIAAEDILFSTVRTYLKNIAFVPPELDGQLTSTGVAILRSNGAVDAQYLFACVRSDAFVDDMSAAQDGTMYPAISDQDVGNAQIALPPLPEQRRIVTKIKSLSSRSKRARDELDLTIALTRNYKRVILQQAYDSALRSAGRVSLLGEIASEVRNGLSAKPGSDPAGVRILRISAVRPMSVNMQDVRFHPPEAKIRANDMLYSGDVLCTRYNGNANLTGSFGFVDNVVYSTTYPDKLIRIRFLPEIKSKYIVYIASAPQTRSLISSYIKTVAGQHGISGADLKKLPLPIVSLSRQQEIVRRIERAFAAIDRLATEASSARDALDKLDQAILAKAFRGELVPQDPDDEPASVLLDRIRAERAAAGPGPKRGRRPRTTEGA